jgi:tRNA (guanine37-N1)-methyltransferase
MRIDVVTLFPDMFAGPLATSILGRASDAGLVDYHLHDIRDWADNRHGKVDDRPFGGGPGMVMTCQPLFDAVTAVEALDDRTARRVLLSPQGEPLHQELVEELAGSSRLLLIAGHYEGIDERVIEELSPLEVSVGDFVTSGGETPSLCLIDAVVRLVPGVLGHADSAECESFAAAGPGGSRLLEGPQYTRPRVWRGREAPEVLLSGDHQAVDAWRERMMAERTRTRRPDLVDPGGSQDEG